MNQSNKTFLFRCKIAGEAGDGIMTAGDLLMKTVARQGFETSVAKSFPSNIRGGYAQSLITISDVPVISPLGDCDVLLALSTDAFLLDTVQLKPATLILVESTTLTQPHCVGRFENLQAAGHTLFSVPVQQFARETAGSCTIRSTIALGIAGELLGIDKTLLSAAITERFISKSAETVELNRFALESGLLWAQQHLTGTNRYLLPARVSNAITGQRLVLEGNQAVALGALAAGCTFYASYPITPATAIGETLAGLLCTNNGFAYQAEDEIAALGSAVGASFCGAKAMTATSGPGLSLMQEFIGYASMVELPVVIVDVQRAGPSTGMPTKHGQDDLHAAIFGGHGEDQRIVIAPVSIEDCFHATVTAFNCAETYQCPVILLSDSTLGLTKSIVLRTNLDNPAVVNRLVLSPVDDQLPYHRYRLSQSGINPMAIPGISPVTYRATGVEHDEDSTPVNTSAERTAQVARRHRKLLSLEQEFTVPFAVDNGGADDGPVDIGICAWGITASIAREAVASLRTQGFRVAAIYPRLLYPVCTEGINRWAGRSKRQVVVEANFTGQYGLLLKMYTDARPVSLTVSRGEPLTPGEIERGIRTLLEQEDG